MTKNNTTIEEKISQLEAAVAWFDSDEFELEKALDEYEKARKLADEVSRDIAELKNTIERVGKKDA